jgi:hypothetical protein
MPWCSSSTDPTQSVIVTDTLATDPTGEPCLFLSKCILVPHLEMAVAYTGIAQVGQRWVHQIQTAVLARNIDQLDQYVPDAFRKMVMQFHCVPNTHHQVRIRKPAQFSDIVTGTGKYFRLSAQEIHKV